MENKIALLIDCDNISFKVINSILKELEQYGDVIIKRAYGNWRSDSLKNWLLKLPELSIKPIHQIDYTKGKNASDMAIVIDAMDLLHLKKVNCFAIVSSDSDFTPLTMKIMEEDFKVYCFGNSSTPISLKNSCSIFTDIQSLVVEESKEIVDDSLNSKTPKTKLRDKVLTIFNKISPHNEYIKMEEFNHVLKEHQIDYKNYHFKQFKVFIDDLNLFQLHINAKSQGFVKLKIASQELKENKISSNTKLLTDQKLYDNLVHTYQILAEKQAEVHLSTYFNNLALKYQFNHKNYGFTGFKDFIESLNLFNLTSREEQLYIVLKKSYLQNG